MPHSQTETFALLFFPFPRLRGVLKMTPGYSEASAQPDRRSALLHFQPSVPLRRFVWLVLHLTTDPILQSPC